MQTRGPFSFPIKVDVGLDDEFLRNKQLLPENYESACKDKNQNLDLKYHEGFDHSYFFIASFVADHIKFHSSKL